MMQIKNITSDTSVKIASVVIGAIGVFGVVRYLASQSIKRAKKEKEKEVKKLLVYAKELLSHKKISQAMEVLGEIFEIDENNLEACRLVITYNDSDQTFILTSASKLFLFSNDLASKAHAEFVTRIVSQVGSDSEKFLDEALELFPNDPYLLYEKARVRINSAPPETRGIVDKIIMRNSDLDGLLLSKVYIIKGVTYDLTPAGIQESLRCLNLALEQYPRSVDALLNRAEILSRMNSKITDAIADLDKVIQINPHIFQAYLLKGIVHHTNNQMDDALVMLKKAISLNPMNCEAYKRLALVYFSKSETHDQVTKVLDEYIVKYDKIKSTAHGLAMLEDIYGFKAFLLLRLMKFDECMQLCQDRITQFRNLDIGNALMNGTVSIEKYENIHSYASGVNYILKTYPKSESLFANTPILRKELFTSTSKEDQPIIETIGLTKCVADVLFSIKIPQQTQYSQTPEERKVWVKLAYFLSFFYFSILNKFDHEYISCVDRFIELILNKPYYTYLCTNGLICFICLKFYDRYVDVPDFSYHIDRADKSPTLTIFDEIYTSCLSKQLKL